MSSAKHFLKCFFENLKFEIEMPVFTRTHALNVQYSTHYLSQLRVICYLHLSEVRRQTLLRIFSDPGEVGRNAELQDQHANHYLLIQQRSINIFILRAEGAIGARIFAGDSEQLQDLKDLLFLEYHFFFSETSGSIRKCTSFTPKKVGLPDCSTTPLCGVLTF